MQLSKWSDGARQVAKAETSEALIKKGLVDELTAVRLMAYTMLVLLVNQMTARKAVTIARGIAACAMGMNDSTLQKACENGSGERKEASKPLRLLIKFAETVTKSQDGKRHFWARSGETTDDAIARHLTEGDIGVG